MTAAARLRQRRAQEGQLCLPASLGVGLAHIGKCNLIVCFGVLINPVIGLLGGTLGLCGLMGKPTTELSCERGWGLQAGVKLPAIAQCVKYMHACMHACIHISGSVAGMIGRCWFLSASSDRSEPQAGSRDGAEPQR